jgi:predicted DNA binding CopG/RHH family protein
MTSQTSRKPSRARRPEPIPEFTTPEEEAAFWDTHDLADYWDGFEPAKVRFAKNLSRGITIRLDQETLEQLRKTAHEKGIGPTTLARMWLLEHLRVGQGTAKA